MEGRGSPRRGQPGRLPRASETVVKRRGWLARCSLPLGIKSSLKRKGLVFFFKKEKDSSRETEERKVEERNWHVVPAPMRSHGSASCAVLLPVE